MSVAARSSTCRELAELKHEYDSTAKAALPSALTLPAPIEHETATAGSGHRLSLAHRCLLRGPQLPRVFVNALECGGDFVHQPRQQVAIAIHRDRDRRVA